MNKPPRQPRPLRDLIGRAISGAFARQGFASTELVTRWADIVGAEVASHAEPMKIQWPRQNGTERPEPGTLILRVEGPNALEIQHLSDAILERVNQFFGWRAVSRLALRQAPLARRERPRHAPPSDPAAVAQVTATLTGVSDPALREALGRLGAAVKRHKGS